MSSHRPNRFSHALGPEQQDDYLIWAHALRLSKFGPWEPSEAIPRPPKPPRPNIPETIFEETDSTEQLTRKPAFRKELQGKITKFFERVLKPIRHRFQRSRSDLHSDRQALRDLQKEIKKEEKRLRRIEKGRDKERRERELITARHIASFVREELKKRDAEGQA